MPLIEQTGETGGVLDVLADGQFGEEAELLWRNGDIAPRGNCRCHVAPEEDVAPIRLVPAGGKVQHGRPARARSPHQGTDPAGVQLERRISHRVDALLT